MKNFGIILISFVLMISIDYCRMNSIHSKIYTDLDNRFFCFLRLNATNQIGCSSSESGNSGLIKVLNGSTFQSDLEFVILHGPDPPYVAVITIRSTLIKFREHQDRVSGVIVLDVDRPESFSVDHSCPNREFSLYRNDSNYRYCRQQQWNKPYPDYPENGLLFEHWPFPIFLLRNRTEINILLEKINEHSQWPRLAVELLSPMSASIDTKTCIRRSLINMNSWFSLTPEAYCDPIAGVNIYGHTFNFTETKTIAQNSVIVLATRLDSLSVFDGLALGSDSVVSGLIALLASIEILNRPEIKNQIFDQQAKRRLFVALFDGESFDYLGSSLAAYQLEKNIFPLPAHDGDYVVDFNLTHLSHFIELNQLEFHPRKSKQMNLFLHKHLDTEITDLVQLFREESKDLNDLKVNSIDMSPKPLPPSSVESFLKRRNDADFKSVVITNHQFEYINKYYHSFYENGTEIDFNSWRNDQSEKLRSISVLISRVVYRLITNKSLSHSIEANSSLINNLMDCFLLTSDCEFFKILNPSNSTDSGSSKESHPPYSTYVNVYRSIYRGQKQFNYYVQLALSYLMGDRLNITSEQCYHLAHENNSYSYRWMIGNDFKGHCIRSTVYNFDSLSPAFDSETLDLIFPLIETSEFPAWTESRWKKSSLRIFVQSSFAQQLSTLIVGIIVLFFSFVIVLICLKHSDLYFDAIDLSSSIQSLTDNLAENENTSTIASSNIPNVAVKGRNFEPDSNPICSSNEA
ncbi:nicastrin-like protein [Sarcoptes scabiei]|uniref:Nicastrin n=1 Tax=Sarcoptes scabiei TaxID=52283 RepID=A0A132AEM1_SARSC|nr:nicastrin-like protein [Sarcoptes scabiei]